MRNPTPNVLNPEPLIKSLNPKRDLDLEGEVELVEVALQGVQSLGLAVKWHQLPSLLHELHALLQSGIRFSKGYDPGLYPLQKVTIRTCLPALRQDRYVARKTAVELLVFAGCGPATARLGP